MPLDDKGPAARLEALEASVQRLEVLWNTGQIDSLSDAVSPQTKAILQVSWEGLQCEDRHCIDKDSVCSSSFQDQSALPSETAQLQHSRNLVSSSSHSCAAHALLQYSVTSLHTMLQDCPYNISGAAWTAVDFLQVNGSLVDIVLCGRLGLSLLVSAQEAWRVLCDTFALQEMVCAGLSPCLYS